MSMDKEQAKERARVIFDHFDLNPSNNDKEYLSNLILSIDKSARAEQMKDDCGLIQFCGFGAMEWRLKVIEKLRSQHEQGER